MRNKTCGECKHFMDGRCFYGDDHFEVKKDSPHCDDRFFEEAPKLTIGDKIIKQGNSGIASFVCGLLDDKSEEMFQLVLSFLNTPADIWEEK